MAKILAIAALPLALLAASSPAQPRDDNRPDGHWHTAITGEKPTPDAELKLTNGRFRWGVKVGSGSVSLEGDYAVTKDCVVFGLVTKVEPTDLMEDMRGNLPAEGDTFSFRFRIDDDEMNVKDLRGKGFETLAKAAQARYKA